MQFAKILCIVKVTLYEDHQQNNTWQHVPAAFRKDILANHRRQQSFLQKFNNVVHELGLPITTIRASSMQQIRKNYGLIITLGGDGTFLKAAHHFSAPILAFNSRHSPDPKKGSVGALTVGGEDMIRPVLRALAEGAIRIEEWPRLYATRNGKAFTQSAVNDIYAGNRAAYASSDLEIRYGKKRERFNCSGIVISTPAGSTAWYRSLGGKRFGKGFSFVVREANKDRQPRFVSGHLNKGQELEIRPLNTGHVLSFDSQKGIPVDAFDTITIGIAKGKAVEVVRYW